MADIKRMLRNALNLTLAGCLLLSLAACGKDAPVTEETETASSGEKRVTLTETGETEPATESAKAETKEDAPETKDETKEPSEGEDADELTTRAIRAKAQKEGKTFAAAYLGYLSTDDANVQTFLASKTEFLPLLNELSDESFLSSANQGEVYFFIPTDENANLKVSTQNSLNGESDAYQNVIYEGTSAAPYVLVCNAMYYPDTKIEINGNTEWYPALNKNYFVDGEGVYDFSSYHSLLGSYYQTMLSRPENDWVAPTVEDLVGITWLNKEYVPEGYYKTWEMTLENDGMTVRWDLGEGETVYENAKWSFETKENVAVLTVDFGEFAGVKSYNLLLDQAGESLYVAVDYTNGPITDHWECQYRFLFPQK